MSNLNHKLFTDSFFKEDFSVDAYLSQCTQKTDLLTLRQDLKNYASSLYTHMVDILKQETEEIITLAENLTTLKSKIDDLSTPVSQLREEIRALYLMIEDVKTSFSARFDKVRVIGDKRAQLNLKLGLLSASSYINHILNLDNIEEDITILERAVNEYSFQHQHLCELGYKMDIIDNEVTESVAKLINVVNRMFLRATKKRESDTIIRCLRMYINLNKENEAEEYLQKQYVAPAINIIFIQRNLDQHSQKLKPLFDEALDFLKNDMQFFVDLPEKYPDITGFNFVVTSFWSEINKQLQNLPNLTAPGNPDLFRSRFEDTWSFFSDLRDITKDEMLLNKHRSFKDHLKRFNLPVYFEIRFQQIAGNFEDVALLEEDDLEAAFVKQKNENNFQLKISVALWENIKRTLSNDVFIIHIADQFFKLAMLLLSRTMKWVDQCISLLENANPFKYEQFLMNVLVDFQILEQLIGPTNSNCKEFLAIPETMQTFFMQMLQINQKTISAKRVVVRSEMIKMKNSRCLASLQQVTSIPRLYRRTNRNIPTEPSAYIIEVTSTISEFYTKYSRELEEDTLVIIDHVVKDINKQYLGLVEEVLRSVSKTEESLRRLKSRNTVLSEDASQGDGASDEGKIREQIKLDVSHFIEQVRQYSNKDNTNIDQLLKLSV